MFIQGTFLFVRHFGNIKGPYPLLCLSQGHGLEGHRFDIIGEKLFMVCDEEMAVEVVPCESFWQ